LGGFLRRERYISLPVHGQEVPVKTHLGDIEQETRAILIARGQLQGFAERDAEHRERLIPCASSFLQLGLPIGSELRLG